MKPQPETFPVSEITIGFDHGASVRGVTELYLPSMYEEISCDVELLEYTVKSMGKISLKVDFSLSCVDPENVNKNLYLDENWKAMVTENLLRRYPEAESMLNNPVPIFVLMLSKYLRVESANLKVNGRSEPVIFDQTSDIIILPDSYPPLCKKSNDQYYSYYEKKNTVFYADLVFNKKYTINIEFDACGTFENAPLFPFGKIILRKAICVSECDFKAIALYHHVEPFRGGRFPEWLEYKFEKKKLHSEPRLPLNRPAFPLRGEEVLFDPLSVIFQRISQSKKNLSKLSPEEMDRIMDSFMSDIKQIDEIKNLTLDQYKTVRIMYQMIIPPKKDFDVTVRVTKNPIPIRIYEQVQDLPNYQDFLVEYDIVNLSNRKARLRVETEISDYTDKASKTIFIHKTNNKQRKRARERISQYPRLKRGVLESICNPVRTSMTCKIKNEDTKEIIYEQSFNIVFLPHDQMIWKIHDVRSDHLYNLGDFICAWIYPNDEKGLFDKVRAGAAKFCERGYLGGLGTGSYEETYEHVKAIYDYLREKVKISYINQPFSASMSNNSQRVVPPERVLKNKAGNCIDLSVLFASLLEGFGIYSLIFLTDNHAFIGWGDYKDKNNLLVLETTMIEEASFEDSIKKGKENFEKYFIMKGAKEAFSSDFFSLVGGNKYIIDLKRAREAGIIAKK